MLSKTRLRPLLLVRKQTEPYTTVTYQATRPMSPTLEDLPEPNRQDAASAPRKPRLVDSFHARIQ